MAPQFYFHDNGLRAAIFPAIIGDRTRDRKGDAAVRFIVVVTLRATCPRVRHAERDGYDETPETDSRHRCPAGAVKSANQIGTSKLWTGNGLSTESGLIPEMLW